MTVEEAQVQGNILHAYGTKFGHARYVFMRVEPGMAAEATRMIARLVPEVTFGKSRDPGERGVHLNLAFTHAGLEALGVPGDVLGKFPDDFREGARNRSREHVGDRGINAPDSWETGFGKAHVLLTVHAGSPERCDGFATSCIEMADGVLTLVAEPQAAGLIGRPEASGHDTCGTQFNREHFGFADGCSQPVIDGVETELGKQEVDGALARLPRKGVVANILEDVGLLHPNRSWRPIPAGEFILGYVDEDGRVPEGVPELGRNGTFMVYRKLRQYVGRFDAHVEKAARDFDVPVECLKAKIIGRTLDGVPLVQPDPAAKNDTLAANAFTYEADPDGDKCPLGAHIRRTNPRDALPGGAEVTLRHRLIRRGMPYGRPWKDSCNDEDERGLIFIGYTASIEQGFEFVQRMWCYDGHAFGLGDAPDYILQQPDERGEMHGWMYIRGLGALKPPQLGPFVTVRGCEYLFVPSRHGCGWLASLHETSI